MNIEIENDYSVLIERTDTRTHKGSFDDSLIYEYKRWLGDETFRTEECLKGDFSDYITDNLDIAPELSAGEEFDEYCKEFRILNWNDIFPLLQELIVIPAEKTCCDKMLYDANYCSHCGTKLNNNEVE